TPRCRNGITNRWGGEQAAPVSFARRGETGVPCPRPIQDDNVRPPVAYLLFTVSGAAALVLEAVLLRQLTWLVGSSVVATSLVLAAFMAGLAIGAAGF